MHLCIYDYLSLVLALSPPSIPLSLSLSLPIGTSETVLALPLL